MASSKVERKPSTRRHHPASASASNGKHYPINNNNPAENNPKPESEIRLLRISRRCLKNMGKKTFKRLLEWLLEIEMGFVWGTAGLSIIIFVFAAIWYIDPALLTLVLRFRHARCFTKNHAFLVGISNCSWTSCRLGCTREIYRCWQIQVEYNFVEGSQPYEPPWPSISIFNRGDLYNADHSAEHTSIVANTASMSHAAMPSMARLYPNVRGCGYPPELNCEEFYQTFLRNESDFSCWVSTTDTSVAITELDLERAKGEVLFSLIPLLIFIVFVLYAFCRMGVFAVCNPLKMCPGGPDSKVELPSVTPKKLLTYKRSLHNKKNDFSTFQDNVDDPNSPCRGPSIDTDEDPGGGGGVAIPPTIMEEDADSSLLLTSDTLAPHECSGKQVITSAQVLPRKPSVVSADSRMNDEAAADLTLLEKELFRNTSDNKKSSNNTTNADDDTKSETNTIINDLFGEELELMDRERLASRYDVVDLKDLEPYRDVLRGHGGHHHHQGQLHEAIGSDQKISRRKHRAPSWDENDDTSSWRRRPSTGEESDFAQILAESTSSTKQHQQAPTLRAKHL